MYFESILERLYCNRSQTIHSANKYPFLSAADYIYCTESGSTAVGSPSSPLPVGTAFMIASPSYPRPHYAGSDCSWTITAQEGAGVRFDAEDLEVRMKSSSRYAVKQTSQYFLLTRPFQSKNSVS